jgi:HK97 family phage major capsid protein
MEFTNMTVEELEARRLAIVEELDADGADLDALEAEARGIKAELEARKAAATKKAEIRKSVADGAGTIINEIPKQEERNMRTIEEIRSSKEYVDAFARYIKTNDPTECRSLLTTNSDVESNPGQLPVPTIIEGRIRTAWERGGILEEVRKTYIKGNVQIGFELTATGAVVHAEGTDAPAEEQLTFGVVTLIPQTIKKWIRISDEAYDMGGEDFLNYIYDEITYRIVKQARTMLINVIKSAPATNGQNAIGVPAITGTPTLAVIAQAAGHLSEDATNVSVTMNRLTHAAFIEAIAANGFLFDPFQGYKVHYSSDLPAYADATTGQTWMIVGDYAGATANFPAGDGVKLKYDDLTEAQADLIKIVGRMPIAIGITEPGRFVKVNKGN